jgi:flagellar biosynthesis/type III secretory pathway protein FliH
MSQPGAETNPQAPQGQTTPPVVPVVTTAVVDPPQEGENGPEVFSREYVEQLRREAAAARAANKTLQKKADDALKNGMSEAERLAHEAREEGAAEVRKTYATRLASSEFRTQAVSAGISAEQLPALLDDLAIEKFVTDDGEADVKKIAAKVKTWAAFAVAAAPPARQSFDGGPRQTNNAGQSMDDMIRASVGITR